MRVRFMTLAATLLLAGCGVQAAEDTTQIVGDAAVDAVALAAEPAADRIVTSAEMATLAREGHGTGPDWALPTPMRITGPMAEIILDAPPDVYLSFGASPIEVDVFAIMSTKFAEDLEYTREDFLNAAGEPTVRCTGTATFPQPDAPPVISGCEPVFGL